MAKTYTQNIVKKFCLSDKIRKSVLYADNIDSFCIRGEKKKFFEIVPAKRFEKFVYRYLLQQDVAGIKNITTSFVKDSVNQIKWFIENTVEDTNTDFIAFTDKVLDLKTLEFVTYDERVNIFYNIDCSSEEVLAGIQPGSLWMKFIREIIIDEKGKTHEPTIDVLQEAMGYYLLNTLEGHVTFFLKGKGNNGKSVVLEVLKNIIGVEYMTSMTVEDLTTKRFSTASLVGKKINICAEDESTYVRSDKFKAIVAGDSVDVERKYGATFSWTPTVKYIFSTNGSPAFSGFNKALLRRIKIIPFNFWVPKNKIDTKLVEKLLNEKAQIISWMIEGAKRLMANNFRFSESRLIDKTSVDFQSSMSAAALFIRENYVFDEFFEMKLSTLYDEYKVWCEMRGKKKQNFYNFTKDLDTIFDEEEDNKVLKDGELVGYKLKVK